MIDVLDQISNPLIQSGAAGGVGVIVMLLKRWRTGLALIAIAGVWAWLCSTPAFAHLLDRHLSCQYPPRPAGAYPGADAIVGLGGDYPPRGINAWSADVPAVRRSTLGSVLIAYRAHKAPRIVLTGNNAAPSAVAELVRQGVPAKAITAYPHSRTTYTDATLAAQALHAWKAKRILLVTRPRHMPRSVAVFRHQGFQVIARPTSAFASDRQTSGLSAWMPQRRGLYLSKSCLHEILGLFYYRIRGWATWRAERP